jgi:hypothetical protein
MVDPRREGVRWRDREEAIEVQNLGRGLGAG